MGMIEKAEQDYLELKKKREIIMEDRASIMKTIHELDERKKKALEIACVYYYYYVFFFLLCFARVAPFVRLVVIAFALLFLHRQNNNNSNNNNNNNNKNECFF